MLHGGEFYWMSSDLARFVTVNCDRKKYARTNTEDTSIGNCVNSHPLGVRRTLANGLFLHPYKDPMMFKQCWDRQA